jgi:hypothetical protein
VRAECLARAGLQREIVRENSVVKKHPGRLGFNAICVHLWLNFFFVLCAEIKNLSKTAFFVSGKQNLFGGSFKVGPCKRIASIAQRRSTGTPQRPPVCVFKWVSERGPVARSTTAAY